MELARSLLSPQQQLEESNTQLSLNIPVPPARPGEKPDFGGVNLARSPITKLPDIGVDPRETHELAYGLIQALDRSGAAVQPWAPVVSPDLLRTGLRAMLLTRIYDEHMFRAQRHGKTSFYVKCRGEEAIGVAHSLALAPDDMCFPHYRMHGFLIARNYPIINMMNQIYSNAQDPLKGRQMPVLYTSREYNYFSHSANLGTQYPQAVGWAMASALTRGTRIASAWIGEGGTAEGDFHYAMTFASVYKAPVILNIVNNQWAISSFQGIAGGQKATFAARGIGYGLPTLRVDGNDFIAVYAAAQWAAQRARANYGATVIEYVTYRAEGHSTSDDPTKYRSADEPRAWPLGDPIDRLKTHLIGIGEWSEERHAGLNDELAAYVRKTQREAEAVGTFLGGRKPDPGSLFDDIYKEPDWRLREQKQKAGF